MKRTIFSLAAVALLAVGCAENSTTEVNPIADPEAIGFELSTGTTRATDNTLAILKANGTGIGVYAHKNGAGVSEYFIANKAYKYTAGTTNAWGWVEEGDWRMWPEATGDYPIDFYAYYPKDETGFTANQKTYTINAKVDEQIDHLFAVKSGINVRPPSGKVTLDFQHILSKIDFKVTTGANVTVHVQSISVKNVKNTGTFSLASSGWSSTGTEHTSDYDYMTNPVTKPAKSFTAASTTTVGDYGSMMLMPQNVDLTSWIRTATGLAPDDDETYVEVVYRVTETDGGEDVVGYDDAEDHPDFASTTHDGHGEAHPGTATEPLFVKVGYPLRGASGHVWGRGHAYTYTLLLGDPGSTGGYLIDEYFIDEDGVTTDLKVVMPSTPDDDYPNIPDPIYSDNDEIGFDVDVIEEWGLSDDSPFTDGTTTL
jgi:hypothetical protein